MPGPKWKENIRNADSNLDKVRRQIDRLNKEKRQNVLNDSEATVQREEIYKSGHTVVEVAIKTKKNKSLKEKEKSQEKENVGKHHHDVNEYRSHGTKEVRKSVNPPLLKTRSGEKGMG